MRTQTPTLTITGGAPGRVGIGTTSPTSMLHVAGSVQVDGNIAAKYQDVAEWVVSAEPLTAGEVVVIDPSKKKSRDGGEKRVRQAGRRRDLGAARRPLGGAGRRKSARGAKRARAHQGGCRLRRDSSRGSSGDEPTPGHAMKSQSVMIGDIELHRPGTVIGKALEPLDTGQGEILVLLTLQ